MSTFAVTGSASGIGAACMDRLRAAGHRTIGLDKTNADVAADLSTAEGRTYAVDSVRRACDGVLDGVVACAGLGPLSGLPGGLLAAVNYFGAVQFLGLASTSGKSMNRTLVRGTDNFLGASIAEPTAFSGTRAWR